MTKIYLDTNIWLDYYFDRKAGLIQSGLIASQIFERTISCEFYVVVSDIIMRELQKYVTNPMELVAQLSPKYLVVCSTQIDIEKAKRIKIHFPDNVHLAIAEREQCDFFVTNDTGYFGLESSTTIIQSPFL